jgi:hypothetical protein
MTRWWYVFPLYTVLKTRCTWHVILRLQTSPHTAWLLLNCHHFVMSINAVTICLTPSLASRPKLQYFFISLSYSIAVSDSYYAVFAVICYVCVLFCNTTWYLQIKSDLHMEQGYTKAHQYSIRINV